MFRMTIRLATISSVALVCGLGALTQLPPTDERAAERPVYQLASLQQATPPPVQRPQSPDPRPRAEETLSSARAFSAAFAEVAAAATPAVVQIRTERSLSASARDHLEETFDRLPEGHPGADVPRISDGTGFLVAENGLVLTNNHVIADADRIRVILWDKRVFDATVVGADPTTDLALVRVAQDGLPYVSLGDSERLQVGEWVLAIGNPGFEDDNTLDFTVTSGIVSAKGRPLKVIQDDLATLGDPAAPYAIEDFIQTDAAINPGNSGGPLLDLDGRVVGVNTAIASRNGVNQGYGFAVPINVARRVMRDLLEYGHVRRPLLGIGIANITAEDAQVYGLSRIAGVLVEDFADDSPAERAGLHRHDVIVAIDGVAVERLGQFQRLVAAREPGETVRVDVIRYGEPVRMPVRLTEAKLGNDRVIRTEPERRRSPELGMELVDLTPALARERRWDRPGGALVAAVAPGSAADRKDVPPGMVVREINRTPVSSAREAERLLASLSSGSIASLLLEYPGGTLIRNVRVP